MLSCVALELIEGTGDCEEVRAALAERMGVNARLLHGFELREGPHGPVPFLGGAELEVRFFDNAG